MGCTQFLILDDVILPAPDSYSLDYIDIESDATGITEAGTMQRDVVRTGVVSISVSYTVSAYWLKELSAFKQKSVVSVKYFDPRILNQAITQMYIENFSAKLIKDNSQNGLWNVEFELKQF